LIKILSTGKTVGAKLTDSDGAKVVEGERLGLWDESSEGGAVIESVGPILLDGASLQDMEGDSERDGLDEGDELREVAWKRLTHLSG
jgi:hypothetical protein